ncbi:MAG: sulfotransferase [Caldilineaceae bacterium]
MRRTTHGGAVNLPSHHYLRPNNEQAEYGTSAHTILQGNLRSWWTDRFNGPGSYHRRLIKEIRSNLLLYWLYQRQPQLKVILLLRHPCAVVTSQLAQGWPMGETICKSLLAQADLMQDFLHPYAELLAARYEPFLQRLLVWAVENYVPLHQFTSEQLHLIFYEELCSAPLATIERLFTFLDLPMPSDPLRVVQKPSALAKPTSAIRNQMPLLDGWQTQIDARQVWKAVDLLGRFGLDQIYGDDLYPNRQAAEQWLGQNRKGNAINVLLRSHNPYQP